MDQLVSLFTSTGVFVKSALSVFICFCLFGCTQSAKSVSPDTAQASREGHNRDTGTQVSSSSASAADTTSTAQTMVRYADHDRHWMHILLLKTEHDSTRLAFLPVEILRRHDDGGFSLEAVELIATYLSDSETVHLPQGFKGTLTLAGGTPTYITPDERVEFSRLPGTADGSLQSWQAWVMNRADEGCTKPDRHHLFASFAWWEHCDKEPYWTYRPPSEDDEVLRGLLQGPSR